MTEILFTVIIPTYNRADFLRRSVESVIAQTCTNWELIVVDDGSTDNTKEVVLSYNDSRIKYIYQHNQEKCIARNTGIKNASGLYICFLDNDDYYLPGHLNNFKRLIEERAFPVAMFICGLYIEDAGKRKEHTLYKANESPLRFIWKTFVVPGAACIHRNIMQEFQFSEKYVIWEDRHLWLRIVAKYPLIQVNTYSIILHEHSGRVTKKFYNKISMKLVKHYFGSIEDVFENYGQVLYKEISKQEVKDFISSKALIYSEIAIKNVQWKETFYLLVVLLRNRLSFIFSFRFIKLLLLLPFNSMKNQVYKTADPV